MPTNLVAIGNFDFPMPSTYEGNTADLVDSARNVNGVVIGAVIRSDVAKVSMTWNYLTTAQWAEMLKKFNPKYGGSFYNNVTFLNQSSGEYETRSMYVSDRKANLLWRDKYGNFIGYQNCSLNLIEV